MRSETEDFEARIGEKVDIIEEGLDDIVVQFNRSSAEFDKFKQQFISKATEKTVSINLFH